MKQVVWVGNAKEKLLEFPKSVQKDVGDALSIAQRGSLFPTAKPLKGIGVQGFLKSVLHIELILTALCMP